MNDYPRLIEHAFPLRQASIDSVHEKNVRHGHISTLHIWPARRPLAAARAALLATLLPDPGTPEGRKELCEKIGGKLKLVTDKEGRAKETTEGGILRWKRETENKATLDWFRTEIRKANGGRAPRVLDPFAGGGAIPLEGMRLGCEVTAADLNPVAWFILKCTLEYPQKLAGQKRPLPDFILRDPEFMEDFLKGVEGLKGAQLRKTLDALGHHAREGEHHQEEWDFEQAAASAGVALDADLAWHVRAWGRKVLAGSRKGLAHLYPTYAEWQPLMPGKAFEPQPMRLIESDESGVASSEKLNKALGEEYLQDKFNPRWVAKPAVAYLWVRTVTCKNCRATIPLLKTRWLCRKEGKRTRLLMEPTGDGKGVAFSIEHNVAERGGNAAQKREQDKKLGAGTMSRAGAQCPCCPAIMETEDIRYEGKNGRLSQIMTAVVVDGPTGKEYRLPTEHERSVANVSDDVLAKAFESVPFGIPSEPLHEDSKQNTWCIQYGVDRFDKVFTRRQLLTLGTMVSQTQGINSAVRDKGYTEEWVEAIIAGLAIALDRTANYASAVCIWESIAEEVKQTFLRFAIPMAWDYAEGNPFGPTDRFYAGAISNVFRVWGDLCRQLQGAPTPVILQRSAVVSDSGQYDVIVTDPPYYDAIGYSVLMDFFYVWLRRTTYGLSRAVDAVFVNPLAPKWDEVAKDGELVDDASRHGGNKEASKRAYEDGMARSFQACHASLAAGGRFVIVFAHKHPDAWETLVSAIIRAGFVVDGSWPIQTEMRGGIRNFGRASLASSIWLVCRKRDPLAKVGWDNRVLAEMRENIATQLRDFWDAGIRGPDFVWAATGPAMEAYSRYPMVKMANDPGQVMPISEAKLPDGRVITGFLTHVRRIVVEFVVGRVLHIESGTDRLDSVTSYYLLHRNDFGFEKAPAGACILYAVSCGLSDAELERTWNLVKVKGSAVAEPEEAEEDSDDAAGEPAEEISGGEFILRTWKERKEKRMGYESVGGREIPLIDRVHRLMHLWRDGDVRKVDDYLDEYALRRNELFGRLIQSLIELSDQGGDERALLESLSNHLGAKAAKSDATLPLKLEWED